LKSFLALIVAIALAPCDAQSKPPRLTGQQFVEMVTAPPGVINKLQLNGERDGKGTPTYRPRVGWHSDCR